jgi:hypothetical protein
MKNRPQPRQDFRRRLFGTAGRARTAAIDIAEIGLRSAATRINDIEGKLLAAAEIERQARRKGKR